MKRLAFLLVAVVTLTALAAGVGPPSQPAAP